MAININTMVAPGARFHIPAINSPTTTAISAKMTDRTTDALKLRAIRRLIATGTVSNADTSNAPTILIAVLMTSAVITVISKFSILTGRPLTAAASSSKLRRNSSLRSRKTTVTTMTVTAPTT
ncbi:hypothetical protein D1872_262700 [compost metagenome]